MDQLTEQKIKDAASIVDVMSDFLELRKDGIGFTCLCPFHDDRHLGSFKISPRRNIYTCFSCGAQGDSIRFLMKHAGYSYKDALLWLANKYCIEVEGSDRFKDVKHCAPRPKTPPLPMLVLDDMKYMKPTLGRENSFTMWLNSLPWNDTQRENLRKALLNYFVGTTKQGQVIFWRMDNKCQLRTGKMMLYENDGHRAKKPDGTAKGMGWIHNVLYKSGQFDQNAVEEKNCLYGLHLLNINPKQVSIVESEKSALICSTVYGNMRDNLWLALGGKNNLTREMLQPIIDKNISITYYPDIDSIEDAKEAIKKIKYRKLTLAERWMQQNWREEDGDKADIADILIRIIKQKAFDFDPNMRMLADTLNLELLSIKKYD